MIESRRPRAAGAPARQSRARSGRPCGSAGPPVPTNPRTAAPRAPDWEEVHRELSKRGVSQESARGESIGV